MKTALITNSCLPNPDDQVWQIFLPPAVILGNDPLADEFERMIENGED
jgi:hypothetical protein